MKKIVLSLFLVVFTPCLVLAQPKAPQNYGESWLTLPAEAKGAIYFGFILGRMSDCFGYEDQQRISSCVEYTRMDEPMAKQAIAFVDEAYGKGTYGIGPDFFLLAISSDVAKGRATKAQAYQELERLLKQGKQAREGKAQTQKGN